MGIFGVSEMWVTGRWKAKAEKMKSKRGWRQDISETIARELKKIGGYDIGVKLIGIECFTTPHFL